MELMFPLGILSLLFFTGIAATTAPAMVWELDTENRGLGPPTPGDLRGVRITGIVMIAMAAIGLYAILTSLGQPAEGPLLKSRL